MADEKRHGGGWRGALAAGFVAGFLGGELFLAAGLLRHPGELFATSPTQAFALWVLLRSAALYGLLFGAAGLALGAAVYLLGRLFRRPLPAFALVAGAMVAATVLAFLTAWWQLDVLAGVALGERQRLAAGLGHAALAAAAGGLTALAAARWRRRKKPGRPRAAAALALGAVLLLGACDLALELRPAADPGPWRPSRVVLVGLDGLTFRVISPLLREGRLPAFRRLVDEGAWGSLLTYGVASSPVVWTSVATGRKARDHGITDFVAAGGSGYKARPVKSFDRRVPALWNILGHAGRTVAVVNWLVTSPPEAVQGMMVTGLSLQSALSTSPPELADELSAALGDADDNADEAGGEEERYLRRVDRLFDAAGYLLRTRRDLDFLALYDRASDDASHRLWKHYQPAAFDAGLWDLDAAAVERLGGVIPAVYARLDRRLGELLDELGDETLLIIASDHGQHAGRRPRVVLHLDRLLVALGFAAPAADGDGIDHATSRAYVQTTTRYASRWRINLNLAGRERRGIVQPAEAPALRDELIQRLREVRLEGGARLFGRVAAGSGRGADVLVWPSRYTRHHRYLDRELAAGGRRFRLADFAEPLTDVSGDHDRQGVIFLHGRGVRRGPVGQRVATTAFQEILHRLTDRVDALDRWLPWLGRLGLIERATTLDLAPTVLHALGLPVARDMAGRPLAELLAGGEVVWVDSYDEIAEPGRSEEDDDAGDDELRRRLKTLGYLD